MGCTVSTDGFEVFHNKPLKEYLNEDDIQLVQESWKLLQNDLEQVGLIMLQR